MSGISEWPRMAVISAGLLLACLFVSAMLPESRSWAEEPAQPSGPPGIHGAVKGDTGDTAWLLMSASLVMLMTLGLAFFYGGLVRRKNVLSVLMQCMMILCLISLQWMLFGYSLSFGPDQRGLIGDMSWAFLRGVGQEPNADYAATVPHLVFAIYQAMFAAITPALIVGAFAERVKFPSFCIFSVLWATFVYCPVAHWIWGIGGFLREMGALDFAGGTVVHINAGMAALAAALATGKRLGYPDTMSPPHNLPLGVLGAGLLWFGWFGFNAGSALGASGLAAVAFVTTHASAAVAGLAWSALDAVYHGKPTVLGVITGVVAGLVAITPAAGFVTPMGAIGIGLAGGIICWVSVTLVKAKLGYDDSLDAFGVHGIGGIVGALATGVWASKAVNPAGADGLLYGNSAQLWIQAKAAIVTMVYSFVASLVLFKVVNAVAGLRVGAKDENIGLDLTQHREAGYTLLD